MITTNQKLQDKIKQLVDVSIGLLNWSDDYEKIYNKYLPTENPKEINEYKTSPLPTMLRFQSSIMFQDVVSNLKSLLCSVKKEKNKKEASFFELIELIPLSIEKEQILDIIKDAEIKFKNNNLDKFRNKFIDHKDLNINFDSEIMYLNFPNPVLVKVCYDIVDSFNNICLKYIDCNTSNTFDVLYSKSHKEYLALIEKALKETIIN